MGKDWSPRKKTVELAEALRPVRGRRPAAPPPSRIRRDPVVENRPLPGLLGRIDWHSREMEIALAIAGIVAFALAIDALSIGISAVYR